MRLIINYDQIYNYPSYCCKFLIARLTVVLQYIFVVLIVNTPCTVSVNFI